MLSGLTELDKEMADNLIAHGQANATHFLLLHKPTSLPNGETVHNRHDFWMKEKALRFWIEQFLP